jgi:hypothetical protein
MALDYLCANAKSSKQGVGPLNKETRLTKVISKNETSLKCYIEVSVITNHVDIFANKLFKIDPTSLSSKVQIS